MLIFYNILNASMVEPYKIISAVFIILFALSLFVIWMLYAEKSKHKKRLIEVEQRMLLSQMNPHFVFNSLTAIQSYIFRNEPYMAGKYMASFAKLVRLILENSRVDLIPVFKERDTLIYYLELQALRFDNKFKYDIQIDSDIDLEHHALPPMLAQPFIENAIEHGIIHMSDSGLIYIRLFLNGNYFVYEVEDNGVGIDMSLQQSKKKRVEHQSLATRITHDRIKNIKRSRGQNISMEIIDLSTQVDKGKRGTLVRFQIPVASISNS